jgi:hypothetical protein
LRQRLLEQYRMVHLRQLPLSQPRLPLGAAYSVRSFLVPR